MASRFEEDIPEAKECGNCGAVNGVMRCSRCRSIYFCSLKCQKAYWPFHKPNCRRNEFADILQKDDPKFARWMRHHGKLATLKDDEIERLERSRHAVSGPNVDEVMNSMYNRLTPKPRPPSYKLEEAQRTHAAIQSLQVDAWSAIDTSLGMDCTTYKWNQNQSHVELYVKLPSNINVKKVEVELQSSALQISWDESPFMAGELSNEIVVSDSYWFINDGILQVCLLKKSRKGHYLSGQTNADTFWKQILRSSHAKEILNLSHPPNEYYWSTYEAKDEGSENYSRLKYSQRRQTAFLVVS